MFEGLATFYEIHLQHKMFHDKTRELVHYFQQKNLYRAYVEDTKDNFDDDVWAMNRHVESPEEIGNKFNFVSYAKASAVFQMFNEAIGETTWIKGVQKFLKEMQFTPAEPKDLYRSLQKAYDQHKSESNIDIEGLMETWVSQPGYPIVNVTKLGGGKLRISQQRFPIGNEIYAIPINFATSRNPNFEDTSAMFWLTNKSIEIEYDADWIVLNIQQKGYHRVNYDQDLWNDIIRQLNRNHTEIHFLNRQFLFAHVLHAASSNFASLATGLRLTTYLKYERDDMVWRDADALIDNICHKFAGYWFHEDLISFVKSLVEENYRENGFVIGSKITNRACISDVAECSRDALELLLKVLDAIDKTEDVHDDIYCNGIRVANETIFWHFFNLMESSDNKKFRTKIIRNLACSTNEKILLNYLQVTFGVADSLTMNKVIDDMSFTANDKLDIIENVISGNFVGVQVAFAFLKENYRKVYET